MPAVTEQGDCRYGLIGESVARVTKVLLCWKTLYGGPDTQTIIHRCPRCTIEPTGPHPSGQRRSWDATWRRVPRVSWNVANARSRQKQTLRTSLCGDMKRLSQVLHGEDVATRRDYSNLLGYVPATAYEVRYDPYATVA